MSDTSQHNNYQERFEECEDKFDRIFKLTSTASKIIAPDLTILKVNQALTELLGYSAGEIEGTQIMDYACEEHKPHWRQLQKALWERKLPFFKLDVCLIKKDKSLVWVNVTTIIFEDRGHSYGFTVLDDFTWRKQYEESEKRLYMALKNSAMAVWEMNLTDYSVFRIDGHDTIFGYQTPLESWSLETYMHHLAPGDAQLLKNDIENLSHTDYLDFKGLIKTTAGENKWVHWQGKVARNPGNQPVKILGTIKDITVEKVAERHKDEFLSVVSHELRTPITSIKAQTQLLEKKFSTRDDATTLMMLQRVNQQINRLNIIIRDLLEISYIDEKKLPVNKDEFAFNELVNDIVADIQRTTNTHQLIIDHNPPVACNGDKEKAGQVLSNLLTNAIKYSPGKDRIIISTHTEQGKITCSVQDFGIGIPPEKQPHVFDRFYRVTDNHNNTISGFGLGLYISCELIKRMEGSIWIKSALNEGSTFYFTIPCEAEV